MIIYLDDILIYSYNPVDHRKHVHEVLRCLHANGLYAHLDKCCFSSDTIEYLGFILTKDGLKMDPSKVQTIQDWPEPQKVQYFTLPHQFQVDSLGVLGSPRDSTWNDNYSGPFLLIPRDSYLFPRIPIYS